MLSERKLSQLNDYAHRLGLETVVEVHTLKDIEKIKECQKNEATSLLEKEVSLNKKYQVTGSPTLIINGALYQGERKPESYKQAICAGFSKPPKECQQKLATSVSSSSGSCR